MAGHLIVQKYGGSSVATPSQISAAAEQIAELHRQGHRLIIVVSAMGKTTDELLKLAYSVSPSPNRRELDMLLSTGERLSMALVAMALTDRQVPAISFTGSQAGVLTDDLHSNARIINLKPVRVEAELSRGHVVILAGFHGVSPVTKEITTLGRGGSDTTAVAMAAHFKAERCEIRKDVDGVHSADPNVASGTRHLPHLHYLALLDMAFWGAKVLHYRSVELAYLLRIPLHIGLAHGDGPKTVIDGETSMFETASIISVNSHKDVRWFRIKSSNLPEAFQMLSRALKAKDLPPPQFLDSEGSSDNFALLITAPTETLDAISDLVSFDDNFSVDPESLSTVTATCQGVYASLVPTQIALVLSQHSISMKKMLFSAMSVTVVLEAKYRDRALQVIHDLKLDA